MVLALVVLFLINESCLALRVWCSQRRPLTQPANTQAWRVDDAPCLKIANK
jgi:hypothetical protein